VEDEEEKRPTAFNSLDPPRNFTLTTDQRVRALTVGVPVYAERKRRIEDLEAAMLKKLVAMYDALVAKGASAAAAREEMHDKARATDFTRVNALIAKHNRWYPVEANLPCDPKTGAYLLFGRKWNPEPTWSAERLVAAFDARIE
jgi:hypothetical protein